MSCLPPAPQPTVSWTEAASRLWEVIVLGAGPAGSLAARQLARRGIAVLLVDRAAHPRPKVCGCCLNGAALATLEAAGLDDLQERYRANRLHTLELGTSRSRAELALPRGLSLSREILDSYLVQEAIREGADYLPRTELVVSSELGGGRRLELRGAGGGLFARARVVLAADGLSGRSLSRLPQFRPWIRAASRIGVAAVLPGPSDGYRRGTIFMACGSGGYVGLVRLEDDRINVAAALDGPFLAREGSPASAAARLLQQANFPVPDALREAPWRGTPALERRRVRLAEQQLFLVGDATGYVEPFTGEGIAWALQSACLVVPLVEKALDHWEPELADQWTDLHRRVLQRRQRICRVASWVLRHPRCWGPVVRLIQHAPQLAAPVIHRLNQPIRLSPRQFSR